MNQITFKNIIESEVNLFPPKPAYQCIPNWWKNISPHTSIENINNVPTVKKCPPTVDILSSGYIIFTQCDMTLNENGLFRYDYGYKAVERWYLQQTEGLLKQDGYSEYVYKFINRWLIETEVGYSCLFMHPSGYPDLPFITLSGIVDTDKLLTDINPPFRIKDGWVGTIKAGTPIAQIIPFKRESWKHSIQHANEKEFLENQKNLRSDGYGFYLKNMRESKDFN